MDKELKACPFCGGIARAYYTMTDMPYVQCSSCHVETAQSADAVEIWNARSDSELLERLKELRGRLINHKGVIRGKTVLAMGFQVSEFQEGLLELMDTTCDGCIEHLDELFPDLEGKAE